MTRVPAKYRVWVLAFAMWLAFFGLVTAAVIYSRLPPAHHPAGWVDPTYCPPDPRECD